MKEIGNLFDKFLILKAVAFPAAHTIITVPAQAGKLFLFKGSGEEIVEGRNISIKLKRVGLMFSIPRGGGKRVAQGGEGSAHATTYKIICH